ncbi:MAG: 16S rRNA (adenine(1518)-N(6)/adenine(1519)-N(6))-dimethyltransferase RsmA [Pseudomonadales bacterium]
MKYKHKARKRFGQNFLQDSGVIDAIVAAVNPRPGHTIVEIGPGQGALTGRLLASGAQVHAIEIDRDLVAALHQHYARAENFVLHASDALTFALDTLAPVPLNVVGNLPYNISTPLLFHLLRHRHCIEDVHVMLQSEVVDRLIASPASKAYGRLSVMLQYYFNIERLFQVPASAFHPQPKVQSAVVKLSPVVIPPAGQVAFEALETVVKHAFAQRRKTLKNNLSQLFQAQPELLAEYGRKRAEDLPVADFVSLAQRLSTSDQSGGEGKP